MAKDNRTERSRRAPLQLRSHPAKPGAILRTPRVPQRTYRLERNGAQYEATIRLWLAGFAEQDVVTVEDVADAVGRLPNAHLEGLKGIIFDRERVTQELFADTVWSFTIKGVFFLEQRCIVLYEFDLSLIHI